MSAAAEVPAPQPLLEIDDASCEFRTKTGTLRAVDGVSLRVEAGETLGLVGESGCGKSTLGRLSLGLEPVSGGSIRIDGTDLTTLSREQLRQLRKRMQMVFQDPISSLNPRLTVADAVEEPLAELRLAGRGERPGRVRDLLDRVGLPASFASRHPGHLSGGQAQRVAIARALAVEPALLVADEAVSSLDVSVAAQILNLLDELRQSMQIAYLFISHDLAIVEYLSDRVAVMYLGKIVEEGTVGEVFDRPQHPYTVALLSATPTVEDLDRPRRERIILHGDPPSPLDPPSGCRFRSRCPIGPLAHPERSICAAEEPPLRRLGDGQKVACHFPGELQRSDQ